MKTITFKYDPHNGPVVKVSGKKYDWENRGWGDLILTLAIGNAKIRIKEPKR